MSRVTQLLERAEKKERAVDKSEGNDEWDAQFDAANEAVEDLVNADLNHMTQDEFVRYLVLVQNLAWDIPSALMGVCEHLDADTHYFMHRPIMDEGWEPADKHFEEDHGWDLNDNRIDWSFDT